MSERAEFPAPERVTREKMKQALRLVCMELPHLAGLANAVQLYVDGRVATAGITATGRLLVNPDWFANTNLHEAAFIAAHELLHLCLQTHERGIGTEHDLFNWAHDYIINDILVAEMGQEVPKGGLKFLGARVHSAEQIVTLLRRGKLPSPRRGPRDPMTIALQEAGLLSTSDPYPPGTGDVLDQEAERRLFPDDDPTLSERRRQQIREVAAKCVSLRQLQGRLEGLPEAPAMPADKPAGGDIVAMTDALRTFYHPPWEAVLQQWLEAVAPGPRTYVRPSRRGADRTDVVLAGRKREGWTLHIVLDTSGSMVRDLPRLLGWIAAFCESVNVSMVHMLQCDANVTVDEFVTPEELFQYRIAGYGDSDMSPALLRLAEDPEIEAALVLTDGYIGYPAEPVPYRLLWVLSGSYSDSFAPAYGHVLRIPS
jgi:hypothetical protein